MKTYTCYYCKRTCRQTNPRAASSGHAPDCPTQDALDFRSPAPAPVTGDCPCGRARQGCTYHDPALQPQAWRDAQVFVDAGSDTLEWNAKPLEILGMPPMGRRYGMSHSIAEAILADAFVSEPTQADLAEALDAAPPLPPELEPCETDDLESKP
jgi:hypothetical protein